MGWNASRKSDFLPPRPVDAREQAGSNVADHAPKPAGQWRSGQHRLAETEEAIGCLAVLNDADGTIAMGLLTADVVYVSFIDRISEDLGVWCARRLNRLIDRGPCSVFLDAHAVTAGDIVARGAVSYALRRRSRELSGLVCLVGPRVVATSTAFVSEVFGTRGLATEESAAFDAVLTAVAPQAHTVVSLANCRAATPSSLPPRVVRSA
jgi:hypothetical protein